MIFLGAMRASLDCRSFENFSCNLLVFSLLIMPHKLAPKPLAEVARELNVDAVVEGKRFAFRGSVRVTAQLIDARTDNHTRRNIVFRKPSLTAGAACGNQERPNIQETRLAGCQVALLLPSPAAAKIQ